MTDYAYRAADAGGQLHEGTCQAESFEQAARLLRGRGLVPVRLVPLSSVRFDQIPGRRTARTSGQIRQSDILSFTSELAIMLHAGLSLDKALRVLIDMSHKESVAKMLEDALQAIKGGATLSKAFASHRDLFGDFYLNMLRSGEAGGNLSEVLARLVEHLERMRALRDNVISATLYPSILLVVAVLSLIAMLGFVVPQFETLFADLGDALPLPTRIVLELANLFQAYGLYFLVAAVLGVAWLVSWLRTSRGRARVQHLLLQTPVIGKVLHKYDITRFARSFGTLLMNGVPILVALDIARQTVGNDRLRDTLGSLVPAVKSGGRLSDSLERTGLFEPLALNLVKVGEETGRLDAMLIELARVLDREVENAIKRGLTVLEPALILVLGLFIAAIIVSILMGILSINDLAL